MGHKKIVDCTTSPDSQFAVLGLGKFGISVAKELAQKGRHVFCCDTNEKIVSETAKYIEYVVQADATNDDFLEKIGIGNFDVVIIAFSKSFEDAILTTMKIKEKNASFVIVKASDERHKKVLESVGADFVILPEVVMGERLAQSLIHNDPLTKIHESDRFDISEILPKEKWLNKNLRDLQLTKKEHINILGIIRDEKLLDRINPDTIILEGDVLIIMKTIESK